MAWTTASGGVWLLPLVELGNGCSQGCFCGAQASAEKAVHRFGEDDGDKPAEGAGGEDGEQEEQGDGTEGLAESDE